MYHVSSMMLPLQECRPIHHRSHFNSNMSEDHIHNAVNVICCQCYLSHLSVADEFRNMKSRPIANWNTQVKNKGNNIS